MIRSLAITSKLILKVKYESERENVLQCVIESLAPKYREHISS